MHSNGIPPSAEEVMFKKNKEKYFSLLIKPEVTFSCFVYACVLAMLLKKILEKSMFYHVL